MTASPELEPEDTAAPAPVAEAPAAEPVVEPDSTAPDQRPLSRLAARFRIPLGILAALIGAALAVVFAVRPLDDDAGARGLLTQGAGVALWLCVAAVGMTWALDTSRKVTNLCVVGAVACYLVFLVSGL